MVSIACARDEDWLVLLLPMEDLQLPDHYRYKGVIRVWSDVNVNGSELHDEAFVPTLTPTQTLTAIQLQLGWCPEYRQFATDLLGKTLADLVLVPSDSDDAYAFSDAHLEIEAVSEEQIRATRIEILGDYLHQVR